jgi:hypothetical protein
MGILEVQAPDGKIIEAQIAGDEPTPEEIEAITAYFSGDQESADYSSLGTLTSLEETAAKFGGVERQSVFKGFSSDDIDTKSGIQNAGLRAELSLAETDDDQVAVLKKYGLSETDFARDNRGRIAVTPEGAKKLGVDTDKLTLIDEEGFSMNDLSDLAGIAPEVIGAIGGAITGQALIPIPILGAAIGAGIGSGTGQGAEEIFEAIRGTQTQSDAEVLEDVATEATIGFLADATFGVLGAGVRGLKGSMKPGKGLTEEELKVAGESLEMGITPTLSAVKAPSVIARQQGITEKVFGTSDRLKRNNDVMQQKLADLRAAVGSGSDEEVGSILMSATGREASRLKGLEREAQESIIQTLDDLAKEIGAATEKNLSLEKETFDILSSAQKAFDDQMTVLFKPIDDALESSIGTSKIIPVGRVKELAARAKELEASGISGGTRMQLRDAINAVGTLKNTDSFQQIYTTRKTLNDILAKSTGREARYISEMIEELDKQLTVGNIDDIARAAGKEFSPEDFNVLRKASERLDTARGQYKRGATIFDELESAGVIKRLREKTNAGQSLSIDDVRMHKIIKNDTPEVLERTLKAVKYAAGGSGRQADAAAEQFRQKLAGEWLRETLNKSGISALDNYAPETFKGAAFAKAVKDLGRTADTLFGADANKIRQLANQIDRTSLSNMKQSTVDQILKDGAPEGLVSQMQRLVNAQKEIFEANKSSAFKKLSSGQLNEIEAAELIAHRATTASDIEKIVKSFADDPDALSKIQGNYMEKLIADFGDTLTTDGKALGAFAKRLLDANEGGKLTAIFGKETGEEMAKFAKILEFNSRTAAGGDLVAANIAASPIQNLGKLAKFTIIGKVLSSGGYYDDIMKQYKKQIVGESPEQRSRILGRLMAQAFTNASIQTPPQIAQEGIIEAERQIGSMVQNSGIGQQLSNIQSQITGPSPASGLSSVNVTQPSGQQTPIRQQAAQNPAVAQALGINPATATLLGTGQP